MRAHSIGVSVSVSVASTQTCVLRASASPYSMPSRAGIVPLSTLLCSLSVDEFLRGYVIITSWVCHVFISQSESSFKKKGSKPGWESDSVIRRNRCYSLCGRRKGKHLQGVHGLLPLPLLPAYVEG